MQGPADLRKMLAHLQGGVWGEEPEEEGGSSGRPGLLQVYPEEKEKVRGAHAGPTPGGRAGLRGLKQHFGRTMVAWASRPWPQLMPRRERGWVLVGRRSATLLPGP